MPRLSVYGMRVISVYNNSGAWIPGYACMEITGMRNVEGVCVREVDKPDASTPQNASMLIINGPEPIPPATIGQGSQDWPLQVLHLASDSIDPGDTCGPVNGQWYITKAGTAFTWQADDPTSAWTGTDGLELGFIGTGGTGKARIVTATVNEASGVADTDTTFSVDAVVCIQDAGANVATTLTFQNTFGFTLDDDANVLGVHDDVNDTWICIQGECPA